MKTNDNETTHWVVYSTFPTRSEALSTAQKLVQDQLVACANIYENVTSVYHWQGAIQQDNEVVLIAKTSTFKVEQAIAAIRAVHSYELPCITAWELGGGSLEFLDWVSAQTAS